MSGNQELDRTLQKAILNLYEVKPKDPIRFLADYFSCKSADDPLNAAFNLFDSLTLFHPATEERIIKCYDILASLSEFEGVLNDACYNTFITQLMMHLNVPSELINSLLDYLNQEISSVVSHQTLRQAILTILLYKLYFEELYYVYDKLAVHSGIVPTYKYKILLIHAENCLKSINDIPRKFPYTLGIRAFCDFEYLINQSSSKVLVNEELYSIKDFTSAAKEIFFRETVNLALSRFMPFDHYKQGDKYAECEYKTNEHVECKHYLYKNDKYENGTYEKHTISEYMHSDTIENTKYKHAKGKRGDKTKTNKEDQVSKNEEDYEDNDQEYEDDKNENAECDYQDDEHNSIENLYEYKNNNSKSDNKAKANEDQVDKNEEDHKDKDQEYEDDTNDNAECVHHESEHDKDEQDKNTKTNKRDRVDKNGEGHKDENQEYKNNTNKSVEYVNYEYEQDKIENSEDKYEKNEQDEKTKKNEEYQEDKSIESHRDKNQEYKDDANENVKYQYDKNKHDRETKKVKKK